MAEKKEPSIRVMTEKGIARFPNLTKADTKFNADGEFKTGVVLSATSAKKIVDALTKAAQGAYDKAKEELEESIETLKGEKLVKAKKALSELKLGDLPAKPVYDEDGNETGDFVLNFKMKAQRKDAKTGTVVHMKPKLFDAQGNPLPDNIDIWGGSLIKVAGTINPFYMPGTNTAGAGLRLGAVQVIELRSSGGGDASSYGFGKEDGYTAPKSAGADEGFGDESNTPDDEDGAPDF